MKSTAICIRPVSLAALLLLGAAASIYAADYMGQLVYKQTPVACFYGGNDREVTLRRFKARYFPADGNYFCPSHTTCHNGLQFSHLHYWLGDDDGNYDFPLTGTDDTGATHTISKTEVGEYYKRHGYPVADYASADDESARYNCFAYCFFYSDIWIQDPSNILQDDYEVAPGVNWEPGMVLCNSAHGIFVQGQVAVGESLYWSTSEKYRESAVYSRNNWQNGATPAGFVRYRWKP